jgi:hypothetical protein
MLPGKYINLRYSKLLDLLLSQPLVETTDVDAMETAQETEFETDGDFEWNNCSLVLKLARALWFEM